MGKIPGYFGRKRLDDQLAIEKESNQN